MHRKNRRRRVISGLLTLLVSVAFLTLAGAGVVGFNRSLHRRQLALVQRSVQNAVIHCYSLEGGYPPSLQYLHDNYGMVLDTSHYIYDYSLFASNVPPEIHILPKD